MKWLDAAKLALWANRLDARQTLPSLIGQLVRASASDISSFRFPAGDSAQIHGWDGKLTAEPDGPYKAFVPEGGSVWEFGVTKTSRTKADADYEKRTSDPNPGITRNETTFVFVTPRTWEAHEDWAQAKRESGIWKDVRVLDAVDLEEWMGLCPAVAASFARDNGLVPETGALSIDEFWDLYSQQFQPPLTEAVLLAGRNAQQQEIQSALTSGKGIQRCKGDSLEEVLGFLCATIRTTEEGLQHFLRARTLIVQTEEAARRLKNIPNLLFAVRGSAKESAGMLADGHRVIVPVGRDDIRSALAIGLVRPTAYEMGEAIQTMGVSPERALQLAHECGKSVTVLARRISIDPSPCSWRDDVGLLGALLAGAWDQALETDQAVIAVLAGVNRYQDAESTFRGYLKRADGPLELVGSVWAVRAPVDMFVQVSHLLQGNHWNALRTAVNTVLAERNSTLELSPEERINAPIRRQGLTHSSWLRDGLATTLLILSALGEQNSIQVDGRSPQLFVNNLVAGLPGLQEDYRVIASLAQQLPMLMEAAPDPLLSALEHLLEGNGEKFKPVFQDRKEIYSPWTNSPHTGILWALEIIGREPRYLQRASAILMRLDAIDPGGTLSNRPSGSLQHLFSVWRPATNASHEMRIAVLQRLTVINSPMAWKLILGLIPSQGEFQIEACRPLFKELGASDRETLTYPMLYKTLTWIAEKASELAGVDPKRWSGLIDKLNQLPPSDRVMVTDAFARSVSQMSDKDQLDVWPPLARLTRRHRSYQSAKWALTGDQLAALEAIEDTIAPKDLGVRDQYLFTERLPDIRTLDHNRVWEQIDELRGDVVRKLLVSGGIESVVRFASEVEAPRYVGSSLGTVEQDPACLLHAVKLTEALPQTPLGFVSSLSSAAFVQFGLSWSSLVKNALLAEEISQNMLPDLVEWWPHHLETWNWVAQFGPKAKESYWTHKHAWGIQASKDELTQAVKHYLEFDRPEYIVDALGLEADRLTEQQWYEVLLAYEARITESPELLRGQSSAYHIQRIFKSLQKRPDVSIEQLALFEYRYLPFLRELLNDSDPDSALDRYLAQKPELFVEVISTVFRPASERGEPRPNLSREAAARAQSGFRLLESFAHVPGTTGETINAGILREWVGAARELAIKADRAEIADQYIGKVLFHAPPDPDDQIWPHRAIRDGLEVWQAPCIEKGIHIAKANARGVTSRGPFDGGTQERTLASKLRFEASRVSTWPRTRQLFIDLAESYEREAAQEDMEVEQLRMRE